jgi:hypothetical protein
MAGGKKEKTRHWPGSERLRVGKRRLFGQGTYVGSLGAFGSLLDFKFYLLTLFQGLVPFHFNGGIMCEDIVAAVTGCDESIPLAGVKPLYSA